MSHQSLRLAKASGRNPTWLMQCWVVKLTPLLTRVAKSHGSPNYGPWAGFGPWRLWIQPPRDPWHTPMTPPAHCCFNPNMRSAPQSSRQSFVQDLQVAREPSSSGPSSAEPCRSHDLQSLRRSSWLWRNLTIQKLASESAWRGC